MIARDSKSYPYLAIAQHYNVPYAEVLKYSDYLIVCKILAGYTPDFVEMLKWQIDVLKINLELVRNAGKRA
jgi:hypothetical protein